MKRYKRQLESSIPYLVQAAQNFRFVKTRLTKEVEDTKERMELETTIETLIETLNTVVESIKIIQVPKLTLVKNPDDNYVDKSYAEYEKKALEQAKNPTNFTETKVYKISENGKEREATETEKQEIDKKVAAMEQQIKTLENRLKNCNPFSLFNPFGF